MQNNYNYKNRGMFLERLINNSNDYYLHKDIALIYKKPTPIKVLHVNYDKNLIEKAAFEHISTLDYNGIYKGKYIEFDAKECKNEKSFPISNIKEHQIIHIRNVLRHKGIIFIILYMNKKFYLYEGKKIINFIDNNSRKSIPYETIINDAYEIKERLNPSLDYLKIVDEVYMKENKNEKEKC